MSTKKEKSEQYFDSIAGNYDNSRDGKFVKGMYQELIARIEAKKGRTESILDLGCGNGNVTCMLAEKTDAKLYGLDLSSNMIKEAQKRIGDRAEFAIGDAEQLPYEAEQFDVVICNASFHHYPNPVKVLREIKRVLKKDGMFILGDPTAPSLCLKILNWMLKYMNSGDYHIYTKKEITKLLMQEGFRVSMWKMTDVNKFIVNAMPDKSII